MRRLVRRPSPKRRGAWIAGCPLQLRVPTRQPHSRIQRRRLPRGLQRGVQGAAHDQQLPEFTGRICPAPCEASCVLGLNNEPVTIEHIEKEIAEVAWDRGWVTPIADTALRQIRGHRWFWAGMAAADQLNQLGHRVKVFERDTTPGGLLTYGIPDYKLEKDVIARRVQVMEDEGIVFQCNTEIGKDLTLEELQESFDAVLLAIGSKVPRDIPAQGRGTGGVHFAMDFLTQTTRPLLASMSVRHLSQLKARPCW